MVKLQGPAMSLDASGKLANALVFSKWKGRPYARTLVTPANPRSALQVGMRAMFKFLSQEWNGLAAPAKAAWDTAAASLNVSAFNVYMKEGLERWRRFTSPWHGDDVDEGGTPQTIINEAATGGPRHVQIDFDVSVLGDGWGCMIFRSPTGTFTTALGNCIAVIPAASVASFVYIDGDLDPATYYYDLRPFTDDGVLGAEIGEFNGIAT